VTLHPGSQACVFIYSSCGRWVFPPLLCSSPPTATFTSFPATDYWAVLLLLPAAMLFTAHVGSGSSLLSCGVFLPPPLSPASPLLVAGCAPLLPPEALQPVLLVYLQFIYSPGKGSLLLIFGAQGTPPSFLCVLFVLIAYYSVSLFFPPDGGQSVQGAVLLWPRLVCGGMAVPGPRLPKPSGRRRLAARGPSLFLRLT
jgi:hypothetical protein